MSEEEFRTSRDREIARHAVEQVKRGSWTKDAATEASRLEFAEFLPRGRATPNYHFCKVLDAGTGTSVGETWYNVKTKGGKVQFWIDWIWVDPAFRRQGYAAQVIRHMEVAAIERGADRVGLDVVAGNGVAIAPYSGLGFRMASHRMAKRLGPARTLGPG